eukprot:Gb_21637 [translate_table: standard]
MATLEIAGEAKPLFHDFLGMSPDEESDRPKFSSFCLRNDSQRSSPVDEDLDGEAPIKLGFNTRPEMSTCSAPARLSFPDTSCSNQDSERLSVVKCGGIQTHGTKSAFRRPEVDSRPAGKKRDSPTSNSVDSLQDHRIQMSADAVESPRRMKMSRFESKDENRGEKHDVGQAVNDLHFAMQPPRPTSSCPTLVQTSASKSDSMVSKTWEHTSSLSATTLYGPSRLGKIGGYAEKISSSAATATATENAALPPPFSLPPADEGSRTGLQGSGIANLVNASSPMTTACRSAGGPSATLSKLWSQSAGSDSSIPPSRQIAAPASCQLTIFYGGQAHVFDDVSPDKADAIISLAGSNGRSWSTTYSPQPRSSLHCSASASPYTDQAFYGINHSRQNVVVPKFSQLTAKNLQESPDWVLQRGNKEA